MDNPKINKLFSAPITEEDINYVKRETSGSNRKKDNFFSAFFSSFSRNAANRVDTVHKIIERIPNFLRLLVYYLITRANFSYLTILFEDKILSVDDLVSVIDEKIEANDMNFSVLKDVSDICPEIVQRSSLISAKLEYRSELINKFKNEKLAKFSLPAAWPSTIKGDAANPRVSKFGGVMPYLNDGSDIPNCYLCHNTYSMICQIYVPTTPQWFQDIFPPEKRDALILYYYCNFCYLAVEGKIFYGEELDRLVYVSDTYFSFGTFNEPRIVTNWNQCLMLPSSGDYISELTETQKYFNVSNEFEKFNKKNGPSIPTYIGGWPTFVQDDCTPPNSKLLVNFEESEASTAMWGDSGTAQLWVSIGNDFGELHAEWACC